MHFRGSTPQKPCSPQKNSSKGDPRFLMGVNVLIVDGLVAVKSFVPNSICEGKLQPGDIVHSLDDKPCKSGGNSHK